MSRFEGDFGKAAQIVARDSERMTRAGATFIKSLERTSERLGKTEADFLRVRAAELGVSDAADKVIAKIEGVGGAATRAGGASAAAFAVIGAGLDGVTARQKTNVEELVAGIKAVRAEADRLRAGAIADEKAGKINPDQLKTQLGNVRVGEDSAVKQLKDAAAQEQAAKRLADVEAAAVHQRVVATERLIQTVQKLRYEETQRSNAASGRAASQALAAAHAGSTEALTSAQANVFLAFSAAQLAATERLAAAQAHEATVLKAVADASERARASQLAAYEAKTSFIAKVNEESAALFRSKGAQRALNAERAGVSPQQAAQLAKVSGDREFIAGIYEKIAAQEKLAETFGKTEAEILKLQAAERGLTNTTASAIGRFDALSQGNKATAEQAGAQRSADAFVESVNRQANAIGKLPSQLLAEEAALKGVSAQTQAAIAKMTEFERKTGQAGKAAYGSANQLQTLKYTISDVVASLGSGISPFTILLQQGGQVAQVEGGVTGIFKTVLSLVTPFRVAVGGAVAAVGGLAFAFLEGHKQSKEFADSVVLSGNYAGTTEAQFNRLAKSIASSGQVQISAAREYGQALIATGEVGPRNLERATEAAARFGDATGKTAKEVAADFASMSQGVLSWATQHNRALNFLSGAQLQQIKRFEEQGLAADAQGVVYDALNARLRALEPNFGTLEKTLRAVSNAWRGFWDRAYDIGRAETLDDKLAAAEKRIAALRLAENGRPNLPAFSSAPALREDSSEERARQASRLEQEVTIRNGLLREKGEQVAAAAAAAQTAELNKKGAAATEFVDGFLKRAKSIDAMNKALAEADRHFAVQARLGTPVTDQNQKQIRAQIREDFRNQPGSSEADAQRKAQLAKDLQTFTEELAKESDAAKFHQAELQAIYAAGSVSLKKFQDDRRATIAADVQAQLDIQSKTSQRLRQELGANKFKDPHERTDTEKQLSESVAKEANIRRDAAHAVALANLEEEASFRQLGEQVAEYRAQLKQLEGDDFGAAQLRALQAIANAQRQARQAGGLIDDEDLDRLRKATTDTNVLAEVQRRVGLVNADATRAEEILGLRQEQNGTDLVQSEREIYQARSRALEQLIALRDAAIDVAKTGTQAQKQAAADLALQVAKAADAVDPFFVRLRDASKSLAQSISQDIGSAIADFKTLPDLAKSAAKDVQRTVIKIGITDPLEKGLSGLFRGFLGGQDGGAAAAEATAKATAAAATAALSTQTSTASVAITELRFAADSAASALLRMSGESGSDAGGLGGILKMFGLGGSSGSGLTIDTSGAGNTGGINGGSILPDFLRGGAAGGTNVLERDMVTLLHKGEAVVPKAFNPYAPGNGGGSAMNLSIELVNNTGTPAKARTEQKSDGGVRVILEQIEDHLADRMDSGQGRLVRSTASRFGLNSSAGAPRVARSF